MFNSGQLWADDVDDDMPCYSCGHGYCTGLLYVPNLSTIYDYLNVEIIFSSLPVTCRPVLPISS